MRTRGSIPRSVSRTVASGRSGRSKRPGGVVPPGRGLGERRSAAGGWRPGPAVGGRALAVGGDPTRPARAPRTRTGRRTARLARAAGLHRGGVLDPDLVHHVADAHRLLGEVLGAALRPAAVDGAGQRDLAVVDLDLDLGCIELVVGYQHVADVLTQPVIRALVALRPSPGMTAAPRAARRGAAPAV